MTRALATLVALAALLAGVAGFAGAAGGAVGAAGSGAGFSRSTPASAPRFVPGEVLVRYREEAGSQVRAAARRASGVRSARSLRAPGLELVRLRRGVAVGAAVASFRRSNGVLYAQPNNYYRLAALPRDPRFGELWGLHNAGQTVNGAVGAPDADVDATEAWDVTKGSPKVTVAIVDSGLAYGHPDLAPNLWVNPDENGRGREANGRDDDRNGLVDDSRGWDFADADKDPLDLESHGTHVAGIVGARGDNGVATTGVNWQVRLMALRVADSAGLVTDKAIVEAFDYAAEKGARVANASFVSSADSPALREAIRRHPKTLFVAAAGNGGDDGVGDDNDRAPQYPCAYTLVNLICVAASDSLDRLTDFSNFGRVSVDLAAPGSNVLSASPAYGPPAFSDGFETDIAGIWVTGGVNDTWGRITTVARSGIYSMSDSPGTTYLPDTDSFVRTASPFSLAGQIGCRAHYALRLGTEPVVDRLLVEVSSDGSNWTTVSDASGSSEGAFFDLIDDLTRFDGSPALFLRFRLVTNGAVNADGAQLDDVSVRCLGNAFTGQELVYNDGTSMAAPHATGVAALIWARYPNLGVGAVREAILRGVDPGAAFAGKLVTGGRLNAFKALQEARKLLPSIKLRAASRQSAGRTGRISLVARCRDACTVVATGKVSVTGASRSFRLVRVTRALRAGRRKRISLRLTQRTQRAVQRALERGRRPKARVILTAMDRRGSTTRARRTIRIKR